MAYPKDELPPPERAREDPQAFELLRLWFAGEAPALSARLDLWPDPAAWGVMLGEIATEIARQVAEMGDVDRDAALMRIRAGWAAEMEARDGARELDESPWGLRHPPGQE